MIKSKEDYRRFLRIEHHSERTNFLHLYYASVFKPTKRFLLLLRTCEYLNNTKRTIFHKWLYFFLKYKKYKLATKLGFSIPENIVDEGLQLPHYGTIIINGNAKIGKHCRIHACVNIGASGGSTDAPEIGDYVYIAPGAKLYGKIKIADRIAIAANAAVNVSFMNSDMVIGGVPAKEIGSIDIGDLIKVI